MSNFHTENLMSRRIGYYYGFVEDCKQIFNEAIIPITFDFVYSKIKEHIDERVGNVSAKNMKDVNIPDFKLSIDRDFERQEKRYEFNFFINWNEDMGQFELKYDQFKEV